MRILADVSIWLMFFATTVFGHVGMKLAVSDTSSRAVTSVIGAMSSFWGVAALLSWIASAFIWAMILTTSPLLEANSVAALRYFFVALAAYFFLKEAVVPIQFAGVLLIVGGIFMVVHGR